MNTPTEAAEDGNPGTGVGASVVDGNGQFLHVSGETPGHFGQLDVSLETNAPIGPDGGKGSLEALVIQGCQPSATSEPLITADLLCSLPDRWQSRWQSPLKLTFLRK